MHLSGARPLCEMSNALQILAVLPCCTEAGLRADFLLFQLPKEYVKLTIVTQNWDSARFKDIMTDYNRLLMDGGRLAIAGTHFHYIKEIPMLSKYHIKSTIICWDSKWVSDAILLAKGSPDA